MRDHNYFCKDLRLLAHFQGKQPCYFIIASVYNGSQLSILLHSEQPKLYGVLFCSECNRVKGKNLFP